MLAAACGQATPTSPPPGGTPSGTAGSPGPSFSGTPAERLTRAFASLRAGYTFDSTLTVKGKPAATVAGRRVGDASELVIESGGAKVTYRIIPPAAWLQQVEGEWIEAGSAVPTGDPLALLLAPLTVESGSGSSDADQLRATYPAAALGLSGTDPVIVTISISGDGSITARYETTVDGDPGVSETVLRPAGSQEPILAPSPLPAASG